MKPTFFRTPSDFRSWLESNHGQYAELQLGFYKKDSGHASITYAEALDLALCYGWIDGVRKRIDDEAYTIRFTPRKQKSKWSAVNIRRVQQLTKQGLMHQAGLAVFAGAEDQPRSYSYEQRNAARLDAAQEKLFRSNNEAWVFFQAQPFWYRRTATWWVISAKKEETRQRRLAQLISASARRRSIAAVPQNRIASGTVPNRHRK
jgi:uncharacterized protein YdeI (YjbR/CyaY-like superfamily)